MKQRLKDFAASIGINETGVTSFDGKTAFVCLFPYFSGYGEGNLSVYAYSADYHAVARKKLGQICEFILANTSAKEAECFADIGPSVDKNLAYSAGLGFYGKNTLIINPRLGSYFFIGYVLTDLPLEEDKPLPDTCLGCGRCVSACPGNALDGGFKLERCASHINQKKGELTDGEKAILRSSGYAFGCDICQRVCPHNRELPSPMPEFLENRIYNLSEDMFVGLSNKEFKERYGGYAFSWRGKGVLLRNISVLNENLE